jgi:predicted O-methyltransferase YrrM
MKKDERLLAQLDAVLSERPYDSRNERFRDIIQSTGGMATPNKLALLNGAARTLESGEVFVEAGTYKGTSIIGASDGIAESPYYTIDNFSLFAGPREECLRNLAEHAGPNVHLVDGDVWEVLANPSWDEPVGVYFYDAGHEFRDQWNAFAAIERLLADDALIIIDDTRFVQVRAAGRAYTLGRREYTRLLAFRSAYEGEPIWWNGIEVYHFVRRNPPDGSIKYDARHTRRRWLFLLLQFAFGRPFKIWLSVAARLYRLVGRSSLRKGWYPDQTDPNLRRYWNGKALTLTERWDGGQWKRVDGVDEPTPGTPDGK